MLEELKEKWEKNKNVEKGVLMLIPDTKLFVSAKFGDGTNLTLEDLEAGLDDYIYIQVFKYVPADEFQEIDGGILTFNSKKQNYYDDLEMFCTDSLDFVGFETDKYQVVDIY